MKNGLTWTHIPAFVLFLHPSFILPTATFRLHTTHTQKRNGSTFFDGMNSRCTLQNAIYSASFLPSYSFIVAVKPFKPIDTFCPLFSCNTKILFVTNLHVADYPVSNMNCPCFWNVFILWYDLHPCHDPLKTRVNRSSTKRISQTRDFPINAEYDSFIFSNLPTNFKFASCPAWFGEYRHAKLKYFITSQRYFQLFCLPTINTVALFQFRDQIGTVPLVFFPFPLLQKYKCSVFA